ncbi:MAG: response regulator [Coleofasciculaceae cyanobacterium]
MKIAIDKHMTKILVIEDEPAMRDDIITMLTTENFQVISAENGQNGLQLAEQEIPALIICDVMMPVLDGYEVLIALRQNPVTALIPLIFLTAKFRESDMRQAMELGADDYLTKPFSMEALLRAVTVRLEKQSILIEKYVQELKRYKYLEEKVEEMQQFCAAKDRLFLSFSEDLRQSISKINLAINMIKNVPSTQQRERYIEILQEECRKEISLLNNVSGLREFLTPENVNILHKYKLLAESK